MQCLQELAVQQACRPFTKDSRRAAAHAKTVFSDISVLVPYGKLQLFSGCHQKNSHVHKKTIQNVPILNCACLNIDKQPENHCSYELCLIKSGCFSAFTACALDTSKTRKNVLCCTRVRRGLARDSCNVCTSLFVILWLVAIFARRASTSLE